MKYTVCHYCGRRMDRPRATQRFCAGGCKDKAHRDRHSDPDAPTLLDAMPENATANDLFMQSIIRDDKRRLMREYNRASFEEIEYYVAVASGVVTAKVRID